MMNIEQYDNLIELLKQALEFYANKNNYVGGMGTITPIDSDENGSQARFALSKITEFNGINQKIQDEYNELTNNMINDIDDDSNSIEINNFIKAFNNGNKI